MRKAKTKHLHKFTDPDGEESVLIFRIPSWIETRDVRSRMSFTTAEYLNSEMYKQSVAYWDKVREWKEAGSEGEMPESEDSNAPPEEHAVFLDWLEAGMAETIDLAESLQGSDLTKEEIQETLRHDVRYKDTLRTVRDVLFFQRGLYVEGTNGNGGAPEVGDTPTDTGEGMAEAEAGATV